MNNLLNEEWLQALPEPIVEHLQSLNEYVISVFCKRIKDIGELSQEDITMLKTAVQYAGGDIKLIEKEFGRILGLIDDDIENLFDEVTSENVNYANTFYEFRGKEKITASTEYVKKLVESAKRVTKETFRNFANTEMIGFKVNNQVVPLRDAYIKVIDRAIFYAQSGVVDYHTAIRSTVKELGGGGVRVVFDSGYTRRLDSQARMNILEGVRQLNSEILNQAGEEFGADGYEISAHGLCAPDHIDIQGKQYTKAEYERLQKTLERPIGTLNCQHFATPIIIGVSIPVYNAKELAEIRKRSTATVKYTAKVNGEDVEKTVSLYEASQVQRQKETAVRYAKDRVKALKQSGDTDGAKQAEKVVKRLRAEYNRYCKQVGLRPKIDRL